MPKRRRIEEREPPVPISLERDGVTHQGYYQLDGAGSEKRITVTYDGESKPAWLHAMEPEHLAKLLLLEMVSKRKSG
jgi:hypothetical protein